MELVISAAIAFAVAGVLGIILIPVLHKLKFGQSIREEGPQWHRKKSGTPTMGGIIFIAAIVVSALVSLFFEVSEGLLAVLICALLFGLIGFADDYIKVVKKRNLGLTAKQKFLAQVFVSVAFCVYLLLRDHETALYVPFTSFRLNLGIWFIPVAVFVIVGMVNSVNLTDGLDGLASFISLVVSVTFAAAALKLGANGIAVLCAALAGGLCGFLIYNIYPAKVFMGDTGSLFIGGLLSAAAVYMGIEIMFFIAGGVFVIETLSVILQVISFKTTGKRIFKMSPIHHHFEMCGYKETKIVAMFTFVTVILSALAYFSL
ncbi:MAG: phospho-N-acetylmuramoyl-pentapeptide-transferase [Clostridia bacterium]|nr:phospho-N-acetylmuramoyl-pentapeptide-transferase [Clostridia bacterium]